MPPRKVTEDVILGTAADSTEESAQESTRRPSTYIGFTNANTRVPDSHAVDSGYELATKAKAESVANYRTRIGSCAKKLHFMPWVQIRHGSRPVLCGSDEQSVVYKCNTVARTRVLLGCARDQFLFMMGGRVVTNVVCESVW